MATKKAAKKPAKKLAAKKPAKKAAAKKAPAKKPAAKKPVKKAAAAKKPASKKKKTISEEAKELGLTYIGYGRYATKDNIVTHINENGILVPYINKEELID